MSMTFNLRTGLVAAILLSLTALLHAAPFPAITMDVGVCDPNFPNRCIAPDASGVVPVSISGTVTATSGANATAAAPSYTEGTVNPISQNLTGDQRVIAKQSGMWTNTVTQATGTNLHAVIDTGSTTAVTGNVAITAAALPLPSGASTAALQSNVQAAATASTPATVNFVEPVDVTGAQPNFATAVPVTLSSQYPSGAVPVSCSTGNVAAATATCTLPATSGKTTYVTGFDITGSGATLGVAVTCTLTNTGSGTHSYTFVAIAGALLADSALIKAFNPGIAATATNTSPVLSCPSLGTGNTNTTINMDGFQL